jgi:hypothetical protein
VRQCVSICAFALVKQSQSTIKVQLLKQLLQAVSFSVRLLPVLVRAFQGKSEVYLLYWYIRTNTDTNAPGRHYAREYPKELAHLSAKNDFALLFCGA